MRYMVVILGEFFLPGVYSYYNAFAASLCIDRGERLVFIYF